MSPKRVAAVALLVAVAGCAGLSGDPETTTAPTSESTTEPHTAQGTSHASEHLLVSTSSGVDNVTVTLGTAGSAETYAVDGSIDLTRAVHERGHDVRVVVERGNETVFDRTVREYQYWEVHVTENATRVSQLVV